MKSFLFLIIYYAVAQHLPSSYSVWGGQVL